MNLGRGKDGNGSLLSAWFRRFWQNWTVPTSGDSYESGHEYSTRAVTLILSMLLIPITLVVAWVWLLGINQPINLIIVLSMDVFAGGALMMIRSGKWKFGRWLQLGAFLLPGIYLSFTSGLVGEGVVFYSLAIILACIQFDNRPRWSVVGFICVFHTFVSWLTSTQSVWTLINNAAIINGAWIGLAVILSLYNDSQIILLEKENAARLALLDEITERKKSEYELQKNQAILNAIIDNMPFDFWACDQEMRYILQNPASKRHWGDSLHKHPDQLNLPPDLLRRWISKNQRALSGEIIQVEEALTNREGSGYFYSVLAPVRVGEEIVGCLGMNLDITDRKRAEKALRENEERLRQVLQNMPVMLDAFDENHRIIVWNRECELVTGYTAEEMFAHPDPLALLYPDDQYRRQMIEKVNQLEYNFRDLELDLTCKNGTVKTVSWSNLTDRFPVPGWHTWSVGIDITERKMTEQRLRYWGHHDSLTGLFNRSYFNEELGRLRLSRQFPVSIIMLDVDDLKMVNDTLGHLQGDELLRRTANVLTNSFRAEDVIARIGGDEFAVLLPFTNTQEAAAAVDRLKSNLLTKNQRSSEPYLGLSIGYATAETGLSLQDAYDLSDINMYKDKSKRKKTGPLRNLTP